MTREEEINKLEQKARKLLDLYNDYQNRLEELED